MTGSTQAVIQNHLRAASMGVEAVLEDYTDESVLITDSATYRGITEIRGFFTRFLGGVPEGFFDTFTTLRMEAVGDLGYIHWMAKPLVTMATDTFVVREGKIRYQTFTGFMAPAG